MAISSDAVYALDRMNATARKYGLGTLIQTAEAVVAGDIALADGKFFVGNASGIAAAVTASGDVTFDRDGVMAIASGAIVNADVNASAAIAYSKLAALTSGNILVGNGSNVATSVAMSGDITISNAGVTAIGANKVLASMLHSEVQVVSSTVSLTQTNIQNLNATPITLVAAAGAGTAIVPLMIEFLHTYSTTAYTNAGGGHIVFEYADGTDVAVLNASRVTDTASANVIIVPSAFDIAASGTGASLAPVANSALRLTKATAEFADGHASNIVKIRVWYRVVTLLT